MYIYISFVPNLPIFSLKTALFHDAAEVRAAALRAIRYLLKDEMSVKSLLRVNLPIFIVRSIDIVLENRTERIQALRLVRKFLSISPHLFPSAFTRSLIAIAQDGQVEHDTLTRACWALLAELSIMSPVSSTNDTQNCAFNAIMDAALTGNQPHGMCESLISTLLYMLNWPKFRCLIRGDLDLQIFVAPFTDSHYTAPVSKDQKQRINQTAKFDVDPYDQRENKFTAAKITLISILRSWQGLIYLCEPQSSECNLVSNSCLKSLINMLYLPYNDVRRRLIDLIFELLYMPLPDSTTDFESGLKFLEKHQLSKDSWKIHDAFVVDEAKAILPPLRSRPRMNLVSDYMALLLVALFHCNVVDALSEVIITPSNQENSMRATILLYQLLSLSYQYLPTDSFSQYLTLSTLISHATSKVDDSRDLANAALINLGRVHPVQKSSNYTNAKSSLFLGQILKFCSPHLLTATTMTGSSPTTLTACNMSNTSTISSLSTVVSQGTTTTNNSSSSSTSTLVNQVKASSRSPSISSRSPSLLSRSPSLSTAASLFTLFSFPSTTKSNLKTIVEQDWQLWDWEHINFILTRPCDSMKRMSSHHYRTFLKRLVNFYKPSSNEYSLIDINNDRCRQLCETGCNMVDFLADNPEPKATELLKELLHDISISMHDSENTNTNNTNSNNNIINHHSSNTGNSNNNNNQTNNQNNNHNHNLNTGGIPITPVMPHSDINILSSSKLITTMSSTYFLFIGRLSSTIKGFQMLERSSIMKLINNLTQSSMLATSPAEVYVRLIISCFDYTKEFNGSRRLLEKFLFHHPEESVRIYATNFLRVLLRANLPDFNSWAVELLVRQLDSQLRIVHHAAADILDEACDYDENLEGLIAIQQIVDSKNQSKSTLDILRQTGDSGVLLLCRYASSANGLRYLIEAPRQRLSCPLDSVLSGAPDNVNQTNVLSTDHTTHQSANDKNREQTSATAADSTMAANRETIMRLESEFDVELSRWQRVYNYRYVKLVEDVLNNSLTYHQKGEDGKYGRRIDRINPMNKNSFLPPHLYGQLALNSEGVEVILTRKLLDPVYEILKHPPEDLDESEVSVLKFKAALWIIGNVGSSESGYQILDNSRELIKLITGIAKSASVLSLRGTAFYVLGLLGSTEEGAEEMKEHRWIVQENNMIALPLDLDLILTKPQDDINHPPRGSSTRPHDRAHLSTCESPASSSGGCNNINNNNNSSNDINNDNSNDGSPTTAKANNNDDSPPSRNQNHNNSNSDTPNDKKMNRQNNWLSSPTASTTTRTTLSQPLSPTTTPFKTAAATDNNNTSSSSSSSAKFNNTSNLLSNDLLTLSMVNLHPKLRETYSMSQLGQIRRDILKYVTNLSSVASRPAENSLLNLKRKFGPVFQYDLGLYSEVCHQLAKYNFRLHARRFLQELFLEITMTQSSPLVTTQQASNFDANATIPGST